MKSNPAGLPSRVLLWLTVAFLISTSCVKQESFSIIPEISFREFVRVFDTGQYAVRGILSFYFQDGDGDIGLNPWDTFPPYDPAGQYFYNLVISYFEKQNGTWVEVILVPSYSARIPVLTPENPGKAIKGFIVDTLILNPAPVFDTIRFDVLIYDRALHQSNLISTPEIPLTRP